METEFTPINSLFGGALIGISVLMLLLLNGRIAGISGIVSSVLPPDVNKPRFFENAAFILGLILAIPLVVFFSGNTPSQAITSNAFLLGAGGLLVGIGAATANGCTSGHGVCGLSRVSKRSIIATVTFMTAAAVTVFILRHVLGGVVS